MGDEPVICFAAGGQHVAITLHAHAHPQTDPDAINAMVAVRSRHFDGRVATTIWVDELWHLQRTLRNLYHEVGHPSRAEWGLLEGELSLTLDLTRLGQLRILVELRYADAASDARLEFSFDADQTYLPLWMNQIAEALEQFAQAS